MKDECEKDNAIIEENPTVYANIYLQLFINALANYDNKNLSFNNITDGYYKIIKEKNKKQVIGLCAKVEQLFENKKPKYTYLNVSSCTFTEYDLNFKTQDKKYILTNNDNVLKIYDNSNDITNKIFVKHNKNGKASVPFYDQKGNDRSKEFYIVKDKLHKKYGEYINFEYEIIDNKKTLKDRNKFKKEKEKIRNLFYGDTINIIDKAKNEKSVALKKI